MRKTIFNKSIFDIIPFQCIICSEKASVGVDLCENCVSSLFALLRPKRILIDKSNEVFSFFAYEYPISSILHDFKFNQNIRMGNVLQFLWRESLKKIILEHDVKVHPFFLFVPNHYLNELKRPLNTSYIFAKESVSLINKLNRQAYILEILVRNNFIEQVNLNRKARYENISNSYQFKFGVDKDKTVVFNNSQSFALRSMEINIIDDVLTTGATIQAITKLLRKEKINSIKSFVLASNHRGFNI